jgi:formylglycine-generating enzyme required for sulfatase activity
VLDWYADPFSPPTCDDCVNTTASSYRVIRGGGWRFNAYSLTAAYRLNYDPANRDHGNVAARCARTSR